MSRSSTSRACVAGPPAQLPSDLVGCIWSGLAARLRQGAVLVRPQHFVTAAAEEFLNLVGRPADDRTLLQLERLVLEVNTRHPEAYVAHGVRNGVNQAFDNGVEVLAWDEARVQSRGVRTIARFARREQVRDLLDEVKVRPEHIDAIACVQRASARLRAGTPAASPRVAPPAPEVRAPVPAAPSGRAFAALDPQVAEAVITGEVTAEEVREREHSAEERRAELTQRELARAEERLPAYVAGGTLTEAEAEQYRALRKVDERHSSGAMDAATADRVRNSILRGDAREALERKVRGAVAQAVRYVQVFESMQRIAPRHDRALDFIVRHKEAVVATDAVAAGMAQVVAELSASQELLEDLLRVIDRSDHEIRMISVRLPPYNYVAGRSGLQRIANLTVEPAFVRELRQLQGEDIATRLHSLQPAVRVRPAADMRCLIALIDSATKRTPFRREVRLVRLARSIEEFYRSTNDMRDARQQAETFIKTRLRRLFPEIGADEVTEIRARGGDLIDSVEQRMLQEREALAQQAAEPDGAPSIATTSGTEGGDPDLHVTAEEAARGVIVAQVELRLAGAFRTVPCRIMPDPDESERHVIAARDRNTGELVPRARHGERRYVTCNEEGVWRTE